MNKTTRNILVIGGIAFLSSFTTVKVNQIFELNEIKNTAEDMVGWVIEDVANNRLDTVTADIYIDNLEEIVNRVQKINTQ